MTVRTHLRNTLEYLEAGARLVWVVDPDARTVTIRRPDGSANILRDHQRLTGEDVLEAFSVQVAAIFDG